LSLFVPLLKMRIYYSLLAILGVSFFVIIAISQSSSPDISKHLRHSYFAYQNFPLRIVSVFCTVALSWNLLRSTLCHKLHAFHVGTSIVALSSVCDLLIWATPHPCLLFTLREVLLLVGLFSIVFHHRNAINLRPSNMICVALWAFGFIAGILSYSYQHQHNERLLVTPVLTIALSAILGLYDYLKFLREPHEEKAMSPSGDPAAMRTLHSDYSLLLFLFSLLLAASHLFLFFALYLPNRTHRFFSLEGSDGHHMTGLALQVQSTIGLLVISFVNIYPSLMAVRDLQVAMLEQKNFYRNLGHEIRTPLNTALMGLQLTREVIHPTLCRLDQSTVETKPGVSLLTENSREVPPREVPSEVRQFIHPELVLEYLRLKAESQVLYDSRVVNPLAHRAPLRVLSMKSAEGDLEMAPLTQHPFSLSSKTQPKGEAARDCLAEVAPYVEDVLASCETAIEVLNEMLLYETLRTGDVSHEFKPSPLWQLVFEPLSRFRIQVCLLPPSL
jgi:signal transduction histidine kinase